jgi:nucleotide sugar dehydrogenase
MTDRTVAVVGAGHIGLPWAAVLATDADCTVTCVDIDETRVAEIERGEAPFDEPGLARRLRDATEAGRLAATTEPRAITGHDYVAFTINAPRNEMDRFIDTIRTYATHLSPDQTIVSRTTVPVRVVSRVREVLADQMGDRPEFVVFPERLAEGSAIEEIQTLPKVVGAETETARARMRSLLDPLGGRVRFTTRQTAMFVKLIDNTYRDSLFAVANQIAYAADALELDSHTAIDLANTDYPRNDIPSPGPVGGKCLPKDPHFLMDGTICDQPTTPDLFNTTRRVNATLPQYAATEILGRQPSKVAMLGLAYKAGVGDTFQSPADDIRQRLIDRGVAVAAHDPYAKEGVGDLSTVLRDADVVVLATNHAEYDGVESAIDDYADPAGVVYDLWGALDRAALSLEYDGFGIDQSSR